MPQVVVGGDPGCRKLKFVALFMLSLQPGLDQGPPDSGGSVGLHVVRTERNRNRPYANFFKMTGLK